jgi:hypothetical protein
MRTRMPRSSRTRAIVVPMLPAPKITTSSTRSPARPVTRHQARAESGEPITTTRSPGRICSPPRGTIIRSPRIRPATFESRGISASRSGRPTSAPLSASAATSSSTIWTLPSANTSVWRAAGMPRIPEIAFAVSSSGETMKSTSSCRSRQASRYAALVVRMIVCALVIRFTSIAQIRLASSRGLQPTNRSIGPAQALRTMCLVVPSPSTALTSKRAESDASRRGSMSITVISCSSCSPCTSACAT